MFGSIRSIGWPYRSLSSSPAPRMVFFPVFFPPGSTFFSLIPPLLRTRQSERDETSSSCRINARNEIPHAIGLYETSR